jgi:ubiquinone/menaquinone biosynthesis C-methylase UbiE
MTSTSEAPAVPTTEAEQAPQTAEAQQADRALKAKHRAMWALGNYDAVSTEVIAELGPRIVEALNVQAGDRVIDIAAGSGNAAIPAARTGGRVVATDLTPELLEIGRQRAAREGLELEWTEADAEHLPYPDGDFDVALSVVGIMFAPHHQASADELLRVTRPGGRIGILSWTPQGFIGELFATMKPYVAPPPPGASPAPLWGDEAHVRELLGDRVTDLRAEKATLHAGLFETPESFRDFFKTNYGPTIAAYRGIADDPARTAQLDADLAALGGRHPDMEWEYLLVTARRA